MGRINWNNLILHIDINSYFATLLQQENPHLRNKPLGVIKDFGRTCIIASSKEAKKVGIKTGANAREAKLKAPNLILLPAQFDRYLDATKRLRKLFLDLSPDVYIYSLDEAFINLNQCQKYLCQNPLEFAQNLQNQVKQELGEWVTCNVGIAPNYLLAKLASNMAKTEGIMEINKENLDGILASAKFGDVCGIGFRLEEKLRLIGVENPYQIRFYSQADLEKTFGPFWSRELLKIAYGEETNHFQLLEKPATQMKSAGRSITGYHLYDKEEEIRAIIYNLISETIAKVRKMKLAGREVGIFLTGEGQSWYNHITVKRPINHESEMFELLYYRLYKSWHRNFKIIRFAVRISLLEPMGQNSLLPNWQRREKLHQALDKVNEKYGLFTARSGALLNQPIIRPEVTGFLGDRIYQLGK